ncbi:hypothetical protein CGLO_05100 [Colletotrichum gloeosporioides Cg-14]|uniref:Uncharacterized protein n=1 Tax=Colletotrichum gloeosporioides (strain Cg-14) TaxID=1237896 RepID=T0KI62_COLGC|nr:hypothetical protein CGLO_05100 [Colletotrichum gloeosporioides Cg-14]
MLPCRAFNAFNAAVKDPSEAKGIKTLWRVDVSGIGGSSCRYGQVAAGLTPHKGQLLPRRSSTRCRANPTADVLQRNLEMGTEMNTTF